MNSVDVNKKNTYNIKSKYLQLKQVLFATNQRVWWLFFLIAIVTYGRYLLNLTVPVFSRIIPWEIAAYFPKIIIWLTIIVTIPQLAPRLRLIDVLLYVLFFLFYTSQYLFYPENSAYLDEYFSFVLFSVVPYYFIGCVIDIKKLKELFLALSILTIFVYYVEDVLVAQNVVDNVDGEYNMGKAYSLLPSAIFITWSVLEKFKIIPFLAFIASLFLLLACGTRGPLFCLFLFIVLILLFVSKGKYRWFAIVVFGLLAVYLFLHIENLMIALDSNLTSVGGSTRIVDYFFEGRMDSDSGRDNIINVLKNLLDANPSYLGFGLFGSWRYVGVYAHRITWDFWFSFGYYFGTLLIIVFLIPIILGLKCCKDSDEKGYWFVLLCTGLIPLFFSEFFLFKEHFFIFIGYCVSRIRHIELPVIKSS